MTALREGKSTLFQKGSKTAELLEIWWDRLQDIPGERAELRRSDNPQTIAFLPVYFQFLTDFKKDMEIDGNRNSPNLSRLQMVLGLLSHVKKPVSHNSLGALFSGPKSGSDTPRVSDLRFRRILRVDDVQDLYLDLIRLIRLIDGEANLNSLASTIYFWGENTKRRLAYQYYGHEDLITNI